MIAIPTLEAAHWWCRILLSILFSPGFRPHGSKLSELVEETTGPTVSYLVPKPSKTADCWAEILSDGLTFECHGLAPGPKAKLPAPRHAIAIDRDDFFVLEGVAIEPGAHVASAIGLKPVLRALMQLGLHFAKLEGARAVHWGPADCIMSVRYFEEVVGKWVNGGTFPTPGLASVDQDIDGGYRSFGLEALLGFELRLEPALCDSRGKAIELAGLMMDDLFARPLEDRARIFADGGLRISVERSENGRFARAVHASR